MKIHPQIVMMGLVLGSAVFARADNSSPVGTTYEVTHMVGNSMGNCIPVFDQALPGAPDDIVIFDGQPEAIRTDIRGTVPTVNESFVDLGNGQSQLQIQTNSPPGTRLFPNNVQGPGGAYPNACFRIGMTDPLDYGGPKTVTNAVLLFTSNGAPIAGPFSVTPNFSIPWDGRFGFSLPNGTNQPINGVVLTVSIFKQPPECQNNGDCDDGNSCTIDTCENGHCMHAPDPCCGGVTCDDGDPCTIDSCVNGVCVFTPMVCDDHDPCTTDICVNGNCRFTPLNCDDGECCTIDFCENGVCMNVHVSQLIPPGHTDRRAFHRAYASCLHLGGGGICPGGGGGGPPPKFDLMIDPWSTHPGCDGGTGWRIGMDPGDPPIPADFFDPGSEPFTGEIIFRGEALGEPGFGETDTLVKRSADPFSRADLPNQPAVTVDLELVGLQLVSCQPITVIVNGEPTQWNVTAGLSDCMPAAGSLTATKSNCNGGAYTYELRVQQKATFTKVGNPSEVRVLDTGCTVPPFLYDTLQWPDPTPWIHDAPPTIPFALNGASSFHTGVPTELASTACGDYDVDDDCDVDDFKTFLQSYGHVAFDLEYLSQTDYDADGDTDRDDFEEWLSCRRCFLGDATAHAPAPLPLGDMDADGDIDGADIRLVVACMLAGNPPSGACVRADIDQNGVVNEDDVAGFLLLLLVLD